MHRRLFVARGGTQLLGGGSDPLVLLEHAGQFLPKRVGHGERFLQAGG